MGRAGRRGKDGQKLRGKGSGKCTSSSAVTNEGNTGKKRDRKDKEGGGRGNDLFTSIQNNGQSPLLRTLLIPIPLQQLLLNVFRRALLESSEDSGEEPSATLRPLSHRIQTLKAHLYSRDFVSAFADADEQLLSAYALRWSAGRALGYAGIFWGVWEMLFRSEGNGRVGGLRGDRAGKHVVCVGGGAGAEIVALAAAWRAMEDEQNGVVDSGRLSLMGFEERGDSKGADLLPLVSGISGISLHESEEVGELTQESKVVESSKGCGRIDDVPPFRYPLPDLSIIAVDIADWSSVIEKLSKTIKSPSVPSSKACPAPLFPQVRDRDTLGREFSVSFEKADVLSLTDEELRSLLFPVRIPSTSPGVSGTMKCEGTNLVTIMFTLNELFSTSIPKTTAFLLRLTDLLQPGAIVLIVDSPGSYSAVALGVSNATSSPAKVQPLSQRKYPMRFLLDHTLLSIATGRWECILSEESRWFRRDSEKLRYDIGEGIRLEDMRFQVHMYRKSAC